MNLEEISGRIANELDFEPDLVRYKREVYARVDSTYGGLVIERRWPWLVRQASLLVLPDVVVPNLELIHVPATVRTFGLAASTLADTFSELDASAWMQLQSAMVGGELDLYDRSLRNKGAGNWPMAPFVIEGIAPDIAGPIFQLDPRCNVSSLTKDEGSFVLRFPRLLLPSDVDQVLTVFDEHEEPLEALTADQAVERWIRNRPENAPPAGRPVAYGSDEGFGLRFPPTVSPATHTATSGRANLSPDLYQRANLPVREDPPFAATVAAGGNLLSGTRYRIAVCWWYAGRFGPLSKVLEVTTTVANKKIELAALPVLDSNDYGRKLAVFVAEGVSGPFLLEGFQLIPTTATRTISERPDGLVDGFRSVRYDEVYPGGPYQYIRLWPRTDVLREIRVRYNARPRRLLSANDEPEFRPTFHEYLVWATLADIAGKHGSAAAHQRWTVKAQRWLDKLSAHYQPEPRESFQKGQVGGRDPSWFPFRGVTYRG